MRERKIISILCCAIAIAICTVSTSMATASSTVKLRYTTAELHSEYESVDPQAPFYVLFHLQIVPGWHTYWLNPGDSGMPPHLAWELPKGWQASEIIWQPPHRIPVGSLMNYGYDHNAYHLIKITPDPKASGKALLKAHASWLVCEEECIPEKTDLSIEVGLGAAIPSSASALIHTLEKASNLDKISGTYAFENNETVSLEFASSSIPATGTAYFYSSVPGSSEPAAKQEIMRNDEIVRMTFKKGAVALPETFSGILEIASENSVEYKVLNLERRDSFAATDKSSSTSSLLITLFLAFLGGVILNAMPCVFPVLSLKALSLSQEATKEAKTIRRYGYSYTLGVIVSFMLVAFFLFILKAMGNIVGWGYQMQSPYFVAILVYLLFLIGLNLSGYFEISFSMSFKGETGSHKESLKSSFATGALVTLVATPCTAPFMATALGVAFVQPPAIGMLIFIAMGLGVAFPYLALTTIPGALKWFPKPGIWMEHFKQFLAFPMFISAIWLIWVFAQQLGINATAFLLLGLVLLTMAIWLWKVIRPRTQSARIIIFILLGVLVLWPIIMLPAPVNNTTKQISNKNETLMYDENTLQQYRDEGRAIFVYATAAWCITCKVNERVAINDKDVQQHIAKLGIPVMVADWTNEDPAITQFLQEYERAGVPLYVFFPAKGGAPRILPQILTPSILIEAFS